MRIKNTSRYPTDEVKRLVAIGTRGVRMERVAVHVKNGAGGTAYDQVPYASPRYGQKTVDRLVVVRIGGVSYPHDNMDEVVRWQNVSDAEYDSLPEAERRALRHWANSDGRHGAQRRVIERHPYGGKRSPLIVVNDWREHLVTVAAHEARHIWQYQHAKPRSEVDCERFAAKALARFRAFPA